MERILSLTVWCLLAMFGMTAAAQSSQIATLLSGEDVEIFFGPESLKQAVAKAADGDVLTLSEGSFDSPGTIEKAITIRGVGMGLVNYEPYIIPTQINGDINLKADINVEAVRFVNSVNLYPYEYTLTKCYVDYLIAAQSYPTVNLIQCAIVTATGYSYFNTFAVNSCLCFSISSNKGKGHANMINCNVRMVPFSNADNYISDANFTNCIIWTQSSKGYIKTTSSSTFYNCIFYGSNGTITFDAFNENGTNYVYPDVTTVFKNDTYYQLEDTYKALKGNDGKEIGIYGGNIGFDIVPNNPQITRFDVAPKTSVDGKLSIDIEVKSAE